MATEKVLTPEGRLRWIHVFDTTDNFNKDGKEKTVTLLIPKKSSLDVFKRAWERIAKEEFKGKIPGGLRRVLGGQKPILQDGDDIYATKDEDKQDMYAAYQGCYVLAARCDENAVLRVLGPDSSDLMDPAELYDGCYGMLVVSIECYTSKKWGAQCSVKLLGVKKTRDGEALESGTAAKMTDEDVSKFFGTAPIQEEDI